MTSAGVRHEACVTVVVPERQIARAAKEAGGGVDGRARVLYGVMAEIEARLVVVGRDVRALLPRLDSNQ